VVHTLTLSVALILSNDFPWTPVPLRTWFWATYVFMLVAGAIALEVALHFSHKKGGTSSILILRIDNNTRLLILRAGWVVQSNMEKGVLHYVYVRRCLGEYGSLFYWCVVGLHRLCPRLVWLWFWLVSGHGQTSNSNACK
jgi:hypothetical protein